MVKLKDITTKIGSGATPRGGKESYQIEGISLIRSQNVYDLKFEMENLAYINDKQAEELSNVTIEKGDILLNITGASVARCCTVPENILPARVNQHVIIIRTKPDKADSKFISYSLVSYKYKQKLLSIAQGGSTREALTKEKIEDFEIQIPALPIQQRIASILSAYDDLIENNTRRIKILDEMAKIIYGEWFVEFKAPGVKLRKATAEEKKVTGKDLFPEGWEVKKLVDVTSSFEDGDWIETKDQGGNDYRLLQVSNIGIYEFVETDNFRFISRETFDRIRCREINVGDILISRMPKPTGRAWLVTKQPWKMITSVDVAIVKVNEDIANKHFVLHSLNSEKQIAIVEQHTTGTTRPRIARRTLAGLSITVPDISITNLFGQIVKEFYESSDLLKKKNQNLRHTRDLLLPKLVSGEIEV